MTLAPWQERSSEEANHFNPAFCGSLIYEFVKSFSKAREANTPFALVFCALPIALHPMTRERLPTSTITSLYTWIERNPDALIGYAERTRNLVPFLAEAIIFAMRRNTLCLSLEGELAIGQSKASFTETFLLNGTVDMRETVIASRKVGRWLAGAGETASVLAAWGVRP